MDKEKYQESLNDIIRNCKGFPCKNDSFYNMQELVDKSYIEYIGLEQQCKKQKEVIDRLNFIKNRKNQGASQENINKMAIEFVNSYLKEVSE